MALREWENVGYLPILSLRPAEMRALEELPSLTKDLLLPITHLRCWSGAHHLDKSLQRISDAYGKRPIVIAIGEPEPSNGQPVYQELEALRNPANGFNSWCELIEENGNFIPTIQFSPDTLNENEQISKLWGLGRGLVVNIEKPMFPAMQILAERVGQRTNGGTDVCFVIDFGVASSDHLLVAAAATNFANSIRQFAPASYVSYSASSFPETFVNLPEQQIYERRLFEVVYAQGNVGRLIYSDRGSARAERVTGGGGTPAPRIDYPMLDSWKFYRDDVLTGILGYQAQARNLIKQSDIWNPNLRVWGTQMIERTAAGDTSAIKSPASATAARINLHLQRQTFFNNPAQAEETDEEWNG